MYTRSVRKQAMIGMAVVCVTGLAGCGPFTKLKMTVPDAFRQQATMVHVDGAKKNKMTFANFSTSKIKRGGHLITEGGGRGFVLENLLWNQIGIRRDETIRHEKARFRYTLTDGRNTVPVYADEAEFSSRTGYEAFNSNSLFNRISQMDRYQYVFSAIIGSDTAAGGRWELMMTNAFERKSATDPIIFMRPDCNGLATNGSDTIFIKAIKIKKTMTPKGKEAMLPIALLSGYEFSTGDGVIAIVDMVEQNIWYYNELDDTDKLTIGGIATALFARRLHDEKW